jgi:hypothetical protein
VHMSRGRLEDKVHAIIASYDLHHDTVRDPIAPYPCAIRESINLILRKVDQNSWDYWIPRYILKYGTRPSVDALEAFVADRPGVNMTVSLVKSLITRFLEHSSRLPLLCRQYLRNPWCDQETYETLRGIRFRRSLQAKF